MAVNIMKSTIKKFIKERMSTIKTKSALDGWLDRNGFLVPQAVKDEITELREALKVAQGDTAPGGC